MNARPGGAGWREALAPLLPVLGVGFGVWGVGPMMAGVAVGVAFVLVFLPPEFSPGKVLAGVLIALGVWPMMALLPSIIVGVPAWRDLLGQHLPLSPAHSLQPAALLLHYPLYLAGLVWLAWACGSKPNTPRLIGLSLILSAVCLWVALQRWESGFWQGPWRDEMDRVLGTRNQAATLGAMALAIGGCAGRGFLIPLIPGAAGLAALAAMGSRGAALFGVAGFLVCYLAQRRPMRSALWVGALVLVGLVVVMLADTPLGRRVMDRDLSGGAERWAIQSDAWRMVAAFPVTGAGLGNFYPTFNFSRVSTVGVYPDPVHPESDWLFLACETGLVGGLLAVVVVVILAVRWIRADRSVERSAALGVGVVVLGHGWVDIPMHSPLPYLLAVAVLGVGPGGLPKPVWGGKACGLLLALLLVAGAVSAVRYFPFGVPPRFSAHSPIRDLPPREALRSWRFIYPVDPRLLEIHAHSEFRSGERRGGLGFFRAVFFITLTDPAPLHRATSLASELDDELLHEECQKYEAERVPEAGSLMREDAD